MAKQKYGTAEKKAYLRYYEKKKKAKRKPKSFARWREAKRKSRGLSRQSRKQIIDLSSPDYEEIRKFFK